MAPLSPPDPPLSDGVVALRLHRPQDADAVVAVLDDPEIVRWTRVPENYSHLDFAEWIEHSAQERTAGAGLSLLIVDAADDARILGSVGIHSLASGRPDIGYWVARGARGRSVASRAARLLAGWALAELGLERIEILAHPENAPSRRVAEKAGFTPTGERRPAPRGDGELEPFDVFETTAQARP